MGNSRRLTLSDLDRLSRGLYAEPRVKTLALSRSYVDARMPWNPDLPKVFGNVTEKVKDNVKWAYNKAKNDVINYLSRKSLEPYTKALKKVNVHIEKLESESGLEQAYTDGDKLGVNEAIVPETNLYSRLMDKLHKHKDSNRFAKYLYGKLSKGYENLKKTMRHELIHVYQINAGLVNKLVKAAEKYIDENVELPDWVKPYKQVLAFNLAVPPLEGLTEATGHEMGGYTPKETKIAISGDPTTYAEFERTSLDALEGDRPSDLQYKSLRDYGLAAKKYVTNFINLMLSKSHSNYV